MILYISSSVFFGDPNGLHSWCPLFLLHMGAAKCYLQPWLNCCLCHWLRSMSLLALTHHHLSKSKISACLIACGCLVLSLRSTWAKEPLIWKSILCSQSLATIPRSVLTVKLITQTPSLSQLFSKSSTQFFNFAAASCTMILGSDISSLPIQFKILISI